VKKYSITNVLAVFSIFASTATVLYSQFEEYLQVNPNVELFRQLIRLHDYRSIDPVDVSDIICTRYDAMALREISSAATAIEHTYYPEGGGGQVPGDEFWSYDQDIWILYRVTLLIRINRIDGNCHAQIRSVMMIA
jgi:hypothetical protein